MVTSHAKAFPPFQGTRVSPSGRLELFKQILEGSLDTGTVTEEKVRATKSFIAWCLKIRADACLQTMAWLSQTSSSVPQRQSYATLRGRLSLRATPTRTASSSSRNPHEAMGKAVNQSPL